MALTGSLDRELVENFVGNEPLGKQPLSEALRKVEGPFVEAGTDVESDRLRHIEASFTTIVTQAASGESLPEETLAELFKTLDKTLKGYRADLEPTQQDELKALVLDRVERIKDIPKNEVGYKAHALYILEGVSEIFEEDLRLKVKKNVPIAAHGTSAEMEALHSEGRVMLGSRSFFRWALWGVTACTSWNGICEFLSLMAHYGILPENSTVVSVLQYGPGLFASLAISEAVRLGKQNIEFIGSTRGLGLGESIQTLFKERTKFAILLAAVMIPDSLTNVSGGIELFYGISDSTNQIDAVKNVIVDNHETATAELEKSKPGDGYSQASVKAARAAIDEALGTYGTDQGMGPRFHGLMAAYFSGQPYAVMTDASDVRCKMGEGQVSHEEYKKTWIIDVPESGTLCAYGQLDNGFKGWIVGKGAGTSTTIDQELASRASGHGAREYGVAEAEYRAFHAEHPTSYPDAVEALWQSYRSGVDQRVKAKFDEIDAVTAAWEPEKSILSNKEESREKIDPYLSGLKKEIDDLGAALELEVGKLGQPYAEFDKKLIQDLGSNGTAVSINPPEFDVIDFEFKPVDTGDKFKEKNFAEKAVDAVGNPLELGSVGAVALMSLIIGYLDMGFFWNVQKAFANDMDRIRKAGKDTIQQMRDLLEALHTHLNRGPFRTMYTPDGAASPTTEKFVKERFVQVMTELSEGDSFATVEEGLLLGLWSKFFEKKGASAHSWTEELTAFLTGMGRIESPAIRAFNRLNKAVDTYTKDPEALEQRVLRLGDGNGGRTPSEMLMAIRDQGKAATGDEMSKRFRSEMAGLIGRKPIVAEKAGENLADRTQALEKKIQILLSRQDSGEEAWILDVLDLQEALTQLNTVLVLNEGEKRQRETLLEHYQTLIQALQSKLVTLTAQAKGGIKALKDGMKANKEEEARRSYEPEFARLEQAISATRYVLHSGAFASEVNPAEVSRILDVRLQEIDGIEEELRKLKPDPTALRDRKMTLKDRCSTVRGELQNAKVQFGGEVREKIYNNRGLALMAWCDSHLSPEALTPETARTFVDDFVALYQRFYRGAPGFVEIQEGEDLDGSNISNAFSHITKEVRLNLDSFNFDEGMSRRFDFAWHMGTKLQAAFNVLEMKKGKIDIPAKLSPLRSLTQKK